MNKLIKENIMRYLAPAIALILVLTSVGCYPFGRAKITKGEEIQQIKIIPTTYSADEGGWQNANAGLVQDLGPEAGFEEFNQENSAYIAEEVEETPASPSESVLDLIADEATPSVVEPPSEVILPEEPAVEEEPPVEEPPVEEVLPEEPPSPVLPEKSLEFSDFKLPAEFSLENKEIRSVQLGLSLAFQNGTDQDNLIIEYEYNPEWYLLAEYRLNDVKSNATNNGYWSFLLPVFDNWQDLEGLKIKFIHRGTEGEIYLDGLWLDIGYEGTYSTEEQLPEKQKEEQKEEQDKEQLQQEIQSGITPLKRNFKVNEDLVFTLPKIENQDLFGAVNDVVLPGIEIRQAKLVGPGQREFTPETSLIQEGDNYKIVIKSSSDFPPGQYFLDVKFAEFGQIYKARTYFSLVPLKKFFGFSASGGTIGTTKNLDWYPERFKPESDYNSAGINVDISSAIDSEGNEQPKLIFRGTCQKEYFVILMFPGPDDYIKDPGRFIYNKAFPCQNSAYFYELNDLPEGLAGGTYYFLVAEQGSTGPWQPITAIQPIQISVGYK